MQDTTVRSEDAPEYRVDAAAPSARPPVPLSSVDTPELLERIGILDETETNITALRERLGPDSSLAAAFELVSRWHEERLDHGDAFTSPQAVSRFLALHLRDRPNEAFAVLFLDGRHRRIAFEILFHGTLDGAGVYPRVIVRRALELNAGALVLAHQHPSGVAEPSRSDHVLTQKIRDACALVDIRVLDHFVIGEGRETVSFAERGWL